MSRKKIIVIVLLTVVVLGGVGAVAFWEYHERPEFCATCHIMQPYLDSWQESDYGAYAHAVHDVACLDCHEPTLEEQVNELVVYMQGDYEIPLEELEYLTEDCLGCHEHGSYEEVIQLTADLELNPHDSHLGEVACEVCHSMHKVSEDYCADCHGAVATGAGWTIPVSLTAEIDVWDPDVDCGVCHVMDPYLDSLEDPDLLVYVHGQEGLECLDCHSDQEELQRVHEEAVPGTPVQALSVEAEFCFDCHVANEHGSLAQVIQRTEALDPNPHDTGSGDLDCATCHKMHEPSTIEWSAEMDCGLCHKDYAESLEARYLLAYAHAEEGLTCTDCHHDLEALGQSHEGAVAGARVKDLWVETQFCIDCHVSNEHTSYEQVIELTADYIIDDQNINPHDPHAGSDEVEEVECSLCHRVHETSPLIEGCYSCHHSRTLQNCTECHG
jgi:nitrate/TMAO reductase-like tetraheme cytochrome c subunit